MCGIYGFIGKREDRKEALQKMERVQIHRGPDSEGHYIDDQVALGMRRLSIIDVENGEQPFYSADGSVVVLCNGEIYNYQELKEELIGKQYEFNTQSDIEVIPHLYQEYGISFIEKLNGMYAIVIWDKTESCLYLVRDRLGIKPLYYCQTDSDLYYASELKSILELVDPEINFGALSSFLEISYIPAPLTPFKNVHKLESGCYLKVKDGHLEEHRYWSPTLAEADKNFDRQESLNEMNDLLTDSIEHQLISDVPVGSFLSGGIDSSIVTALSAKASNEKFSSFHMYWNGVTGKIDESPFAQMVADQYELDYHEENVGNIDIPSLLPKLVWHLDEPFSDAAFIPTYILAKMASSKVKVILSGAGGDELYGGYSRYKHYSPLKSLAGKVLVNKAPAFSFYDLNKGAYTRKWKQAFPWFERDVIKKKFEQIYQKNRKKDKLNAYMLGDILTYLQDDILALTDKMTSAVSLECRVPLLDHRLVEQSLTIPSENKVNGEEYKAIFKEYAEQYLPKELLYRQKEGFGSPVWAWVSQYRYTHFQPLVEEGYLLKNGLINQSFITKLFNKQELDYGENWMFWSLVILEIWFQLFKGKIAPEDIFKEKE